MIYLNRWELKGIYTEVPYNLCAATLHVYHLFIMITMAFVWSIMNPISLL